MTIGDKVTSPCGCVREVVSVGQGAYGFKAISTCSSCESTKSVEAKEKRKIAIGQRLLEIDAFAGPRTIREVLIADNKKGFNNKIETLENEAKALRAELAGL